MIATLEAEVAVLIHGIATADGPATLPAAEPVPGSPTATGSNAEFGAAVRETNSADSSVREVSSSASCASPASITREANWVQFSDGEVQVALSLGAGSDIVSGAEGTSPPPCTLMGQPSLPTTEVTAVTDLSSPLPEIAAETPAPVGPPIAESQAPVGPPIASRTVPPATETPDVPSATVVDATTLLPALRQHHASIAAAPPQESALRAIADICVDRNSVDWLDDMLDVRHGTSLTSFRQRQRCLQ